MSTQLPLLEEAPAAPADRTCFACGGPFDFLDPKSAGGTYACALGHAHSVCLRLLRKRDPDAYAALERRMAAAQARYGAELAARRCAACRAAQGQPHEPCCNVVPTCGCWCMDHPWFQAWHRAWRPHSDTDFTELPAVPRDMAPKVLPWEEPA